MTVKSTRLVFLKKLLEHVAMPDLALANKVQTSPLLYLSVLYSLII